MGNRACVIFFDHNRVSPTVYLHWHGDAVPRWLDQLKATMHGRFGDAAYAAARFVGICHAHIQGNLSLGIWSNGLSLADLRRTDEMEAESPGNAGIVVVDTSDFSWKADGGYLAGIHEGQEATNETKRTVAEEALDAFWHVVVQRFPQAQTGDLSPLTAIRLKQAAESAIEEWVWANVPTTTTE
jgi:hypothetical protein